MAWQPVTSRALPAKPVKGYVEVRYQIDSSGTPVKPEVVAAEPPASWSRARWRPSRGSAIARQRATRMPFRSR
ncbi:hypothetical protein ACF2JD_07020 [Aeromonas sp. A-5]|uniref:hypothetical protein n=1 Tax=Aeromonas ichthyocola TaxID=3367746 RepID=UPI0038D82A05